MGFKINYNEQKSDTLEVYLSSIIKESEESEKGMLRDAGEKVKEAIVKNLNKHRRILSVRYKDRPAMADDVKVSIRTEKWGNKSAKVMGGKMTGTLWHLVNDGHLHAMPTHFMDSAMTKLDGDIDKIWDKVMR